MKKNLTKVAARKKIITHLEKRGHISNFEVTSVVVIRWWTLLNKALFDDKLLPPKKIICRAFREDWGWCMPLAKHGHVHLGLHREFLDRKEFITILAHEMVHQWQWTFVGKMDHGKSFYQWAPVLKKVLNLPLEA